VTETKPPARPLPAAEDPLVAEFWGHCNRGELRFQRCGACGAWRHLPRFACASCGSADWSWQASSGRGRIHSWTITHQPLLRGFPEPVPYAVIVVHMDEGVRVVSGLRGLDPARLALDLPVEVTFETVADGIQLPFFRPREG
jgi:uncharacterized OB-fold protein